MLKLLLRFSDYLLPAVNAGCHTKTHKTTDLYGYGIRFSQYNHQWVIINYWSAYCKHCLDEMTHLNQLYLNYKNHVMVFGVNTQMWSNKKQLAFIKMRPISYPLNSHNEQQRPIINQLSKLPATFIESPGGKLKYTLYELKTLTQLKNYVGIEHD